MYNDNLKSQCLCLCLSSLPLIVLFLMQYLPQNIHNKFGDFVQIRTIYTENF